MNIQTWAVANLQLIIALVDSWIYESLWLICDVVSGTTVGVLGSGVSWLHHS